ncbi:MAG: penicillin-binding transpeptidase domain-containing protein, partial [Blastocatellia bacterium]
MLIPITLTIIFSAVALLLAAMLAWKAWRLKNPVDQSDAESIPREFGPAATNRWLYGMRAFLLFMIAAVFGVHCYWVFSAGSDPNSEFSRARRMDTRNIRLAESGLKGWMFDRTGKLENALIRYRYDAGAITRDYPLGAAAVHITGYSDYTFGSGGMEYAFRKWLNQPASGSSSLSSPVPVGQDLKVSIDSALQREVFNQLQKTGKPSAAVVLLVQDNEILSLASSPSFEPRSVSDEDTWERLTEQADSTPELSPLVDRALGTVVTGGPALYYRPGSTFKTFIAAVAIENGMTNERFTCRADGFTPPGSGRPVRDYEGEVHGTIGFRDAFRLSCNQYFAQLGLKLGKERLADYARRMGFASDPKDGRRLADKIWDVAHGDQADFNFIFAPPIPRMNLSREASNYDIALESFGQGYDDMTVFEMALLASAAANPKGLLIAPTFEVGIQPKIFGQFISEKSAGELRQLMKLVVESGTAAGAFAPLRGRMSAAGKTGTADRIVPVYDKDGEPVVEYVDKSGQTHY